MTIARLNPAEGVALQTGDRVHHPQKGNGTVVTSKGGIVSARFDDGVIREFLEAHPGVSRLTAFAEGRMSPAWAELGDPARFIPPLTEGERHLAHFLDDVLPPEWRIYVRPHLDADRNLSSPVRHPVVVITEGASPLSAAG